MVTLGRTREPLHPFVGWAVLGVTALFLAGGVLRRAHDRPFVALGLAVAALAFVAVTTLGPEWFWVPGALATCSLVTALASGTSSNIAWFVIAVLAGWFAINAQPLVVTSFCVAAVVLFTCEAAFEDPDPGWVAWMVGTCLTAIGCWFGSRQHELVVQLREAQAGLAQRAQAEERNRIARELHDVIAHSLTVSLLHVSSARLALEDDPADAARALAEAERLGRDSLDEVRHAVGLLRHEGESDPTAPLPGTVDVDVLLERFRSAGTQLEASVEGGLSAVPGTVGLATYRILQESLTNAAKHAPEAAVTVHLAVHRTGVELTVDSAGSPQQGTGLGLLGMQERAAALGGTCEAGPGGSGWVVHAELPLKSRVSP